MTVLKNKSYKEYTNSRISRYLTFPYYYNVIDNKYVYGTTSWLNTDIPFTYHIVKQNDTYDSISLYYYNNPTLYWVICDFNRITDPFRTPNVGEKLKIPNISNIDFIPGAILRR